MADSFIRINNEWLTSIDLYETRPEQQPEVLERLSQDPLFWSADGCKVTVLHRSLDGLRIMIYRQWLTEEAYHQNDVAGKSISSELVHLDGNVYRVVVSAPVEADLAFRPGRLLHLGEFHLRPDKQHKLVTEEQRIAPIALQHPDLQSVNFHRSLDNTRTMNYGFWQRVDRFEWLLQEARFEPIRTYWRPYAAVTQPGAEYNEFHLYEIYQVR